MSAVATRTPSAEPRALGGRCVGIVGGGQLARMTQRAAIDLGVELRVLTADPDAPAVRAGATHVHGSPDRLDDLRAFAAGCDVVTFDHERIPPEHLRALSAGGARLAPGPAAKLFAQDKAHARRGLAEHGFPVPPFALARTMQDVERFAGEHGPRLVAKAPRGGYDGRGVWVLATPADAAALLSRHPGGLLLEPQLKLSMELAVLVARTGAGAATVYPVVESVQRGGMCRELLAPAPITTGLANDATQLALEIADAIGAVGLLAVEFFVCDDELLVNELALRPHNSGHYTIEGATTSQFEQHLRAVLGWPLGATELTAPAVATVNVVGTTGDPRRRLAEALAVPGAHIHIYDKAPRRGRKLGHVTVAGPDAAAALAAARRAAAALEGSQQ